MNSPNFSQAPTPHLLLMRALAPAFSALTHPPLTRALRLTVMDGAEVGPGVGVRHPGMTWILPSITTKQFCGVAASAGAVPVVTPNIAASIAAAPAASPASLRR